MHRFLQNSEATLDELLKLMQSNPKLEIKIIGYICCLAEELGDGTDNETGLSNLSEARAIAVANYLVDNGIKKNASNTKAWEPKIKSPKN